jgi:hypothetical protein
MRAARERFNAGTHVFRRCLHNKGYTPLDDFNKLDPQHSVLIVLGDPSPLLRAPPLADFLRQGGGVLFASDWRTDGAAGDRLVAATGVRVVGDSLINPDPNKCYGQRNYHPFVVSRTVPPPPLLSTAGVDANGKSRVATDAPSYLERPDGARDDIPSFAYLPQDCLVEGRPDLRFKGRILFGIAGEVGPNQGRVLVLADHSIFINAMMLPQDTRNVEFTEAVLAWLRGDDRKRSHALLVVDGQIETKFNLPIKQRPTFRQIEAMIGAGVDEGLARMERRGDIGAHNEWLDKHIDFQAFWRWSLALLTVGLFLFVLARFGLGAMFRREGAALLLSRAAELQRPADPVPLQRNEAMLKTGNLWEAARDLARRFFDDALGGLPERAPRVQSPRWGRRRSLQNQVDALWELAHEETPTGYAVSAWSRLVREVEELRADLADGTFTLHA